MTWKVTRYRTPHSLEVLGHRCWQWKTILIIPFISASPDTIPTFVSKLRNNLRA